MEIPEWIDSEIVYNPMYWLLVAGAEFALILGFKAQIFWSSESMPFLSMLGVLAAIPVVAYFVVMKIKR